MYVAYKIKKPVFITVSQNEQSDVIKIATKWTRAAVSKVKTELKISSLHE